MDVTYLIGRIAFSLIFIVSGLGHLAATDSMAGYAESRGVKPGRLMVIVSGLGLMAGGVAIALGVWIDLAAILLAILLLSIAVLMHPFWRESGESRQMEQVQFFKDISLAGAALLLFAFAANWSEHPFSITDRFFN